jgi:rRNA maturation RNase YbeY
LNKEWLGHNYYTDILTFDLSPAQQVFAEVYISCDRVGENADINQTTFKKELHRVIFHGVLHLCGYEDKTAEQKEIMRKKEDHYLRQYFL